MKHVYLFFLIISLTSAEKYENVIYSDYSEFFNFGSKKLNGYKLERKKFENTIFKSKVDILGAVFKRNIDKLKLHGSLDLIFLIDASSSVGQHNFQSELKFVKKILSDVTVDFNHTRVSIITFSSKDNIIVNVDEISKPNEENNKCLLLNNDIKNIVYTGGGTYTLGAFQKAQEIFKESRSSAQKVLLLITDGFSNGGDPIPVANELKSDQVIIFTIGVINGNYNELYELSSRPGEQFSYLLDSFEEFESLARRALHVDLQSGDYIPLGSNFPCKILCTDENCCDDNALCTCGTTTGHYSCLCVPGYYGSGLKNACSSCPSGSYSNGPNLCIPCPDVHHVTYPPAIGIKSCKCKNGYQPTEDNQCEVIKCIKIKAPNHGYFVKQKECGNVLNTACGVRCNIGYTLTGSSIRLCQPNATWSGTTPSCEVKNCNKLHSPSHGVMSCKHSELGEDFTTDAYLPVDTICNFSCEKGYTLIGSTQRTCLPLAQWDGLRSSCKQIKCNKLSKVNFGSIEPKSCINGKQPYGKVCNITCQNGFEIVGPKQKICSGQHGAWNSQEEIFCKDVTKPNLECPENKKGKTLKGKPYGYVNWDPPSPKDNSNLNVTIWTKPAIKKEKSFKFKIGNTTIVYFAQDASGNIEKCSFSVHIEDGEPPTIEQCIDPPPYLVSKGQIANISWNEPNIFDNSQNVFIHKSIDFGVFKIGTTSVEYTATDNSNNTNMCTINITVQESTCEDLPTPAHGDLECETLENGNQCIITCEDGYAIPINDELITAENNSTAFVCEHSSPTWKVDQVSSNYFFAECTVTKIPLEINQSGVIEVDVDSSDLCDNNTQINEIVNEVSSILLDDDNKEMCTNFNCSITTESKCENGLEEGEESTNIIKKRSINIDNVQKHMKRKKKLKVKFDLHLKNKKQANSSKKLDINTVLQRKKIFGMNINVQLSEPQVSCPKGMFNKKLKCISCPEGTFHNISSNLCQSCRIGFFNDKIGQASCFSCPQHFSTKKLNAKSFNDCLEECPPGTFARKKKIKHPKNHPNAVVERLSLKPYCSSCPIGTYQTNFGQSICLKCSEGTSTYYRGAIDFNECANTAEDLCLRNETCLHGECVLEDEFSFSCVCDNFYTGTFCDIKMGICASNPCQNNGTCLENMYGYTCHCTEDYHGRNCADVKNDCDLDCLNNGTCMETEEDEKICLCPKGTGGSLCEIKLYYCSDNLCENDGECLETNNTFTCVCKHGFIGRRCTYLPCDFQPCNENQICINLESNNTNRLSYKCECPLGYFGDNCSILINNCEQNPCKNGGTCSLLNNNYVCHCFKGFYGNNCENVMDGNFVLNFDHSSLLNYVDFNGFEQNISEVSICFWINTNDTFNYGTIISYATNEYDNAFTLTDYSGLVLYVNNKYVVTDIVLNDGLWHHVCCTWSGLTGEYEIFVDANLAINGTRLAVNEIIKGGGKIIIGQEQDVIGGKFSESESFLGKLTLLDIYGGTLSNLEVRRIMNSCNDFELYGDIYAWAETKNFIRGSIKEEYSNFCKNCPEPEPLYNGVVSVMDNIAYYKCKMGFYLSEEKFLNGRRCTKAAKWEGFPDPICKIVDCGYPSFIENGFIIGKSYKYLDEVTYKCNFGFNLTGTEKRVCLEHGSWFPEKPICEAITCEMIQKPKNSNLIIVNDEGGIIPTTEKIEYFPVGTQIEINCDNDSFILGESILTCLYTGNWDFKYPMCKLKGKYKLVCSLNQLPQPPINGYVDQESLELLKNGARNSIEYKCRKGYMAIGDNSSTCILDGYWSEVKIACVVKTCREPPKFSNMQLVANGINQYHVGNLISYKCYKGYLAFGQIKLRCLLTGVWSHMAGKCIKISCGKPKIEGVHKLQGSSFLYGDRIKVLCTEKEFKLKCNSNGTWGGMMNILC